MKYRVLDAFQQATAAAVVARQPGDEITLSEAQSKPLLEAGVIEPVRSSSAAKDGDKPKGGK